MKKALLVLLIASPCAIAQLNGEGQASFGLSKIDNVSAYGTSLDYALSHRSNIETSSMALIFDYASDDKGAALPKGHAKLYEKNLATLTLDNELHLIRPNINWVNGFSYESSTIKVSDQKTETWNVKTGPTYRKSIRKDLVLDFSVNYQKDHGQTNDTESQEALLGITKRFSSGNSIGIQYEKNCWEYDNNTLVNDCLDEVMANYQLLGSRYSLNMSYGVSLLADSKEEVYSIRYSFSARETDQIEIRYDKQVSNLRSQMQRVESLVDIPPTVLKESYAATYTKQFRRSFLQIYSEKDTYTAETIKAVDKGYGVSFRYVLGNRVCPTCSIRIDHSVDEVIGLEFKESNIAFDYPLSKHLVSGLAARKTQDELQGNYYSFHFQISYSGAAHRFARD